ncbi:MAG: SpoIIE family protein phosphatase [Candidatus Riflebacteria bacterium]|nr:SpoIIE family protein phosphatase [Candidatus Riflebacteria bacterium]
MNEPHDPANGFSWARWAGLAGFFLGIPILLALGALALGDAARREEREQRLRDRLEQAFSLLETGTNPTLLYSRLLRNLERHLYIAAQPNAARVGQMRRALTRRFPGLFTFTFLDSRGAPIPGWSDGRPPRALLQRFFQGYLALAAGRPHDLPALRTFISSFFGPLAPVDRLMSGQVLQLNPGGERSFVYLSQPRPEGMMIVHLGIEGGREHLALADLLHRAQDPRRGLSLALIDHRQPWSPQVASLPAGPAVRKAAWRALLARPQDPFRAGNRAWGRRPLTSRFSVFGCVDLSAAAGSDSPAQRRALLLLWVMTALGLWLAMHGVPPVSLSVRQTLALAFTYAAGLPLLVMALTAHDEITQRRRVLEERWHRQAERVLRQLDARFPQMIEGMRSSLQAFFRQATLSDSLRERGGKRLLARMQRRFSWDFMRIVNAAGQTVLNDFPLMSRAVETESLGMFNRWAVPILANLRSSTASGSATTGRDKTTEFLGSRATGELGALSRFDLHLGSVYFFLYPLFTRQEEAEHLAILFWSQEKLESTYLERNLLPLSRTLPDTSLLAVHRLHPTRSQPDERAVRPWRRFADRIRSPIHGLWDREETGEETTLLTGLRGSELTDFDLVAVSGDRFIREEIRRTVSEYALAGLLTLLISLAVGTVVAQAFLVPIGDLAAGVAAMERRAFSHRLPVHAPDEFGALATAFNRMLEEMADLEVARIVQEQVFPAAPLQVGGWEVFGSCRPATEVGGDYLDYFPLPGDRIMVVLGDVSGHGVAAALVVAMAKAVVGHPERPEDPVAMLQTMNAVLSPLLKKRRMMTCTALVLEPGAGRLLVANAGHSYPLQITPFSASEPGEPGFPLGARRTLDLPRQTFALTPATTIVLYTDGLVEAPMASGEPIGYARLLARAPGLCRPTAPATVAAFREWHEGLAAWNPPGDDVTILALQPVTGAKDPLAESEPGGPQRHPWPQGESPSGVVSVGTG